MVDDGANLFSDKPDKARRRPRRKQRPVHLPPFVAARAPTADEETRARKQVAAGPATNPTFGAARGATNVLLFHTLKSPAMKGHKVASATTDDDGGDDDAEG